MLCPTCKVELRMTERQGVEIDYCPQCRGVWLDRGELDKIIERSGTFAAGDSHRYEERKWQEHYDHQNPGDHSGHKKHKRRSFLDDLFDFD